jgi:putative tryptophan/tyrosine transport system substrate-binding protein
MRRREFIGVVGGAAAWPFAARAQRPLMPVIGLLGTASAAQWTDLVAAFHQGLGQTGFFVGQNLRAEYLWADGQFNRLPALAAELVQHQVAAIVTTGSGNSTRAAKAATATIPIVFVIGTDPVSSASWPASIARAAT